MGNVVFNIAKGRINELVARVDSNDPANSALVLVLLKTAEADATLIDYDTLDAILTAGGGALNVESNATNYARKVITDTGVTAPVPDDGANTQSADITTDPVWVALGGATNNALVKLLVCYDPDTTGGTDADIVPLTAHDFVISTNGGDITAQLAAAGFYTAS